MNLPTIPTDTLYKFKTVGGVVLVASMLFAMNADRITLNDAQGRLESVTAELAAFADEMRFVSSRPGQSEASVADLHRRMLHIQARGRQASAEANAASRKMMFGFVLYFPSLLFGTLLALSGAQEWHRRETAGPDVQR
jgi:hypothetical protein